MRKDRSIRPFQREDAAVYQTMAMDFYGGDATLYPMTAEKLGRSMDMALSHPDRFALHMLVEGEEVVGYMALTFCFSTEAGGEVCWVEELYLRPGFRSKGWGKKALGWVMERYPGMARFRLEVAPANDDARRLYERLGFVSLSYEQLIKEK